MRGIIEPAFARLGFSAPEDSAQLDIFFRAKVIHWACALKIKGCTDEAAKKWRDWMNEPDPDKEGANP